MSETVQWYPPGDSSPITIAAEWNVVGRLSPPPVRSAVARPLESGTVRTSLRYGERKLTQQIILTGTTQSALVGEVRTLARALDPMRGVGTLKVTRNDGSSRLLFCCVDGGLEGIERLGDDTGYRWQRFPVSFVAEDPYWYDTDVTTFTVASGSALSGGGLVTKTWTNPSDVEEGTPPVFVVEGPGTYWTIDLSSSTYSFAVGSLSLTSTDELNVDMFARTVQKQAASGTITNKWPDATGHMFRLPPGTVTMRTSLTGATSESAVKAYIRPRYLTC